jgi:capsular polysaccharide biosynthesis protein
MNSRLDVDRRPVTMHQTDRELEASAAPGGAARVSIWSVMRRWRALLIGATLAATVAGYVVGSGGQATYEAKAVLLVGPINTDFDTVKASGQLAQTYAELATTEPVLAATERRVRLRDIGANVTASANAVTRLLTIRVKDTNRTRAVNIARAYALEIVALGGSPQGSDPDPGQLSIVEPAEASASPIGLGTGPVTIAAALIGFLGALGLAFILDRSSGAVRDDSDVTAATGAPCLDLLSGRTLRAEPGSALVRKEPKSRGADEIRRLGAKLRAVGERSLLVLEVDDRAVGVAANLAVALTAGGRRVALVDAGEDQGARIPKALAEGVEVIRAPEDRDGAAQALHERLLEAFDVVVVRAEGLDRSPAGLAWGRIAAATLLIAGTDRTTRGDLTTTVESLRLVHARLLGTVLGVGSPYFTRR